MSLLIRYRTLSRNPGFRGIWLDQSVQHGTPDLGGHGFKSHVGHGASLKERKKGRKKRREGRKERRRKEIQDSFLAVFSSKFLSLLPSAATFTLTHFPKVHLTLFLNIKKIFK